MVTTVILPVAMSSKHRPNEKLICQTILHILDSHSKNRVAVRDYELRLWGIDATPRILHFSISKPSKIE